MATIHVPVGATPTENENNLQAALDAAVAGDVITLAAGQTYVLNDKVDLPNKGAMANYITIRSDASDANLPADGVRIDPSYAPYLPKIRSLSTRAAFETAVGAQKYKLMFLEFHANAQGFGDVLLLGCNETKQTFWADQPNDIIVDRVWIHGDLVYGQKRGIGLNGRNLVVKNSRIEDIFGVGQDTQTCATTNGSGPISIINNYLAAAGYSYICGGDAQKMYSFASVAASPAPTTSGLRLENFRAGHTIATMRVGMTIAIMVLGGTERRHTVVRSINSSTKDITFDPIDTIPDSGAGTPILDAFSNIKRYSGSDVSWGEQLEGLTVQRNHITRPLKWMNPILDIPANVAASPGTGGTLAAGTYYYKVQAFNPDGYNGVDTYSKASVEVSATVGANGSVQIDWSPVTGATSYRIYGREQGTVSRYFTSSGTTFTDTGAAGTAATSIAASTKRVAKNLFELKQGTNVQIDSNIIENHWPGSEAGYALWLKSNSFGETSSFVTTKNVVIEKNIIRHVAGGFSILSRNGSINGPFASERITNMVIRNNLIYDSDDHWLDGALSVYGAKIEGDVQGFTFEHNTFLHQMKGAMYFDKFDRPCVNASVKHNLFRKEQYGIFGAGVSPGSSAISHYIADWADNVVAGASGYPAGTQTPTYAEFEANFVNYDAGMNGDYSLAAGSPYIAGATDGKDLGCNVAEVLAATANTLSGGAGSPQPPSVTTTSLANGQATQSYSQTLVASGGTSPITWSISAGSLPPGLSLNASTGAITGTPTTAGTYNITVKATDANTLFDTEALSITIAAAPVALNITTTTLPGGVVGQDYSQSIQATGGTAPYAFTVSSGQLPAGLSLATDGTVSGTPTTVENPSFTVMVTDSVAATDTQALSLNVVAETLAADRPIRWDSAEAKLFRRTTAPTAADGVAKGDLWIDISTNPPAMNGCVNASPVQWLPFGGAGGGVAHELLSASHSDAQPATPHEGDLIVGTGTPVLWSRFPAGPAGTYLRSDGTAIDYVSVDANDIASGTLDNARLPSQLDIASRVNAPVFGCDTYIAFTEVADPGVPGNNRFARLFYDIADRTFKVWENGVKRALVGGGGGGAPAIPQTVCLYADVGYGTLTAAQAAGATFTEFDTSFRHRVKLDLTNATQMRIQFCQGNNTANTAKLAVQYSTNGTSFTDAGVFANFGAINTTQVGAWTNIPAGMKADVFLRFGATGGDGTEIPEFGNVYIQVK